MDIQFNFNIRVLPFGCLAAVAGCFNCTAACDFNCPTVALFIQDRLELVAEESPSVFIFKISINCCTFSFEAPPLFAV